MAWWHGSSTELSCLSPQLRPDRLPQPLCAPGWFYLNPFAYSGHGLVQTETSIDLPLHERR